MVLADDLVECARAQTIGERARPVQRGGFRGRAEHVVLGGRSDGHADTIARPTGAGRASLGVVAERLTVD